MDHIGIIKNALQTTIRYRALWILGFLWALTGGGMSGGTGNVPSGANGSSGYQIDRFDLERMGIDPGQFAAFSAALISGIILACCLLFLLGILITIVRYVIQAGVYRSLAQLELQGVAPTVRGAFREGWHRRTWRMFLQNLLVFIVTFAVLLLLALVVAGPVILLSQSGDVASALGIGFSILFGLCWFLLLAVAFIVIGVLSQFWWRAAVIDDQGFVTAMRSAWGLVKHNPTDVLVMWLLMLGIGILFALVLIPVALLLGLLTAAVAGGPGYLIYQATESIGWALAWGIPVGLLAFMIPLAFVGGLYLIFHSSVWNQMYHALVERTGLAPE